MINRLLMLILILMGLAFGSQLTYADEQGGSADFWEKLRNKIDSFTSREKDMTPTTATAGVRGAPVASDDIYWKGEAPIHSIDPDELQAFKNAMGFVDAGDHKQAQAAFSEFISTYPDSPLRKDAEQALVFSTP